MVEIKLFLGCKMASCKNCVHSIPISEVMGEQFSSEYNSYYCMNLNIRDLDTDRADFCTFYTSEEEAEKTHDERELLELKREFLMEMTDEEISTEYEISTGYASMLHSALKENRFGTLIDDELSVSKISEELEISESSVRAYLTALRKVGILKS